MRLSTISLLTIFTFCFISLTSQQLLPQLLSQVFGLNTEYSLPDLINTFIAGAGYTRDRLLRLPENVPIEDDVTFWCLNRETRKIYQTGLNDTKIHMKIDINKPVVFVIHGFLDHFGHNWMEDIMADYIEYQDVNVCSVDWSRLAVYEYRIVAQENVFEVGMYLAVFVLFLEDLGIDLDDVTLVGHSLGAHIAGIAGDHLRGKVNAIYALDPAGPMFTRPTVVDDKFRLDRGDAKYVQVIYTTKLSLGAGIELGHQSFHPNGGINPQPPCITPIGRSEDLTPGLLVCSHNVAHDYFRYSLNPKNVFIGRQCNNLVNFRLGVCFAGIMDKMGIYSERIPGKYYLSTSPFEPYVEYYFN